MGIALCCTSCCPAKATVGEEEQDIVTKDEAPHGEEGKTSGPDQTDSKFSDYINRAKIKIRTTSTIGRGKHAAAGHQNINEKVSNYINRAKIKLRAPSNIGVGKNVPVN